MIELFDAVQLKDGREAVIVEILSDTDFIVDVDIGPEEWETISITLEDIAHTIH